MKPQRLRSEAFMAQAMDAWADAVYRIALSHMRSARHLRCVEGYSAEEIADM